jgi:hypothetical protein
MGSNLVVTKGSVVKGKFVELPDKAAPISVAVQLADEKRQIGREF